MPVFEYQCTDCNGKYEVYHKSLSSKEEINCPTCSSENHKKLFSSFAASMETSSSGDSCATGACGMPAMPSCANGMCGLN